MRKAAMEVLEAMRSGVEFAYDNGCGYLGNRRIKKATGVLRELQRAMVIRRIPFEGSSIEYYRAMPEPSGNSGELMKPLNIVEENPRGLSDAAVRACLDNDHCPYCADGELDTGYECNKCGADCLPIRERLS